jgi:hypothetical protein
VGRAGAARDVLLGAALQCLQPSSSTSPARTVSSLPTSLAAMSAAARARSRSKIISRTRRKDARRLRRAARVRDHPWLQRMPVRERQRRGRRGRHRGTVHANSPRVARPRCCGRWRPRPGSSTQPAWRQGCDSSTTVRCRFHLDGPVAGVELAKDMAQQLLQAAPRHESMSSPLRCALVSRRTGRQYGADIGVAASVLSVGW